MIEPCLEIAMAMVNGATDKGSAADISAAVAACIRGAIKSIDY